MARWSWRTLLEPDHWARLIGFHPCHWNGVGGVIDARACADAWFQYIWQADPVRAGRETVGQAVLQAEQRLAQRLNFFVAPQYITSEEHPFPCSGIIGTNWNYLQEMGVEARDDIQVTAAATYSDTTGDGLEDTGTITVTVPTGTDPCEIAVYYAGEVSATTIQANDETWRIKPLNVSISGTTATITGDKCQFVLWSVHETAQQSDPLPDISDNTKFMTTVDVYRRYTDNSQGAVAIWDNDCSNVCGETTQAICAIPISERVGTARLSFAQYSNGSWSSVAPTVSRAPDRVRLNYLAGWRAEGFEGCDQWGNLAEIVAKLSVTMLRENICQCQQFSWLWNDAKEKLEWDIQAVRAAYSTFGTLMKGALDAYNFYIDERITPVRTLPGLSRSRHGRYIRRRRLW